MPQSQLSDENKILNHTLQKIIEEIRLLVVGIDRNGKIIYANPFFLSSTGFTLDEILNKDIYDIFIPLNTIETFDKKVKLILANNLSMQSENPILKKDGTKIFADWHNFPIIEEGAPIGVLSVGVNITSHIELVHLLSLNEKTMRDRAELYAKQNAELEKLEKDLEAEKLGVEKKVEERTSELNQEKARLIASINSIPHGFLVTDTEDNVLLTNQRLSSIFEVKKVEWHINDLRDFLGDNTSFLKYYGFVKTSKKPYLIKDIDMGRKYMEIYISPIFLSPLSNETIGSVILVSDITEQKIIERSKDEFLSIASHELRTPLTAIRGNAQLIKKHFGSQLTDSTFGEIVSDIELSSVRLINLVNEFLNMSRLEQGKMLFRHDKIDVVALISDIVKELTPAASAKNLYLKFDVPSDLIPNIMADADKVREVVTNLIGNSITYTDSGGITLTLEYIDDQIKIRVLDTGKGIPLQYQNMLFRKFQQANPNIYARTASQSTGLGLYISKLIVEAMHGTIYLEKSQPGVGSVFAFILPVA